MCLCVCRSVCVYVFVCLLRDSGLVVKHMRLPLLLPCFMLYGLFNRFDYGTLMLMSLLDYTSAPAGSDSFVFLVISTIPVF